MAEKKIVWYDSLNRNARDEHGRECCQTIANYIQDMSWYGKGSNKKLDTSGWKIVPKTPEAYPRQTNSKFQDPSFVCRFDALKH